MSGAPDDPGTPRAVLLLDLAGFFVGATWLVATYILQEELNKLARY